MVCPDLKVECLKQSDIEVLSEYLNAVVIPQWKTVTKEKKMTARERLSASKYKNVPTHIKTRNRV